ncbi:hypothetical protein PHBOTO_006240 [Pseudozyma hubeiensis]|nr:hypothetical protein PHBOTO_006240 [Pseudozyma hubeiensis]
MRIIIAAFVLTSTCLALPMNWDQLGIAGKESTETFGRELSSLQLGETYRPRTHPPRLAPLSIPQPAIPRLEIQSPRPPSPSTLDSIPYDPTHPSVYSHLPPPAPEAARSVASGGSKGRVFPFTYAARRTERIERQRKSNSVDEGKLREMADEAVQDETRVQGKRRKGIVRHPSMNDLQWNDEFARYGVDREQKGWVERFTAGRVMDHQMDGVFGRGGGAGSGIRSG